MNWHTQPLSSLGRVQTGSTPSTSEERYWGGEIPFVTPGELDQSIPVTFASRTLSDEGGRETRLLREGAVMVCCIGSLGKIGIAGRTLATNQQINSVEFDPQRIWPRFGFYACQRLKPKLLTMAPATTVPIVSKSKFEQLEIPVPSIPEQRRIAAILDQADALLGKRREALVQMDNLRQSIFLDMFGNPATNPRGWALRTLKQLGKVITGGTPPSAKEGMFDGSIPFVTPGDLESEVPVKRSLTDAGAAEVGTVCAGATLVCCIGTIGKMYKATTQSAFNQQINAVEWSTEVNDSYGFAAIRFFKPTLVAWGASTTVPILKKSSFEQLEIPVPPIGLQTEFAQRIQAMEKLQDKHRGSLIQLDVLFSALKDQAFRGEL